MSNPLMKHQQRKPVSAVSSDSSRDPLDSLDLAARIERRRKALTVREFADAVHLSPKLIYLLAAKKIAPSYRIKGSIRFDPHLIAEWLRNQAA